MAAAEASFKIWIVSISFGLKSRLAVVIKPSKEANYGRTVDILDEMTIDDVKHYAFIDISPEESQVIDLYLQKNGGK